MSRLLIAFFVVFAASQASANEVEFGDNSSDFANDGECDDRRFVGEGMAIGLDEADTERDASDCEHLYNFGLIKLWDRDAAQAATQCTSIVFGDNSSDYARDGECDDPRFQGPGTSSVQAGGDIARDAEDCRSACDAGQVFLRNY